MEIERERERVVVEGIWGLNTRRVGREEWWEWGRSV